MQLQITLPEGWSAQVEIIPLQRCGGNIAGCDQLTGKAMSTQGVRFYVPADAVATWLPEGYRLVTNPDHIIEPTDCIMPSLDNNWRVVSTVNAGARVGRCARDAGQDVLYVVTRQL
jgi:hypothetical protein